VPELPEVETIVRSLAPKLKRRRILSATFHSPLVMRQTPPPQIHGATVRDVRRHGKFIVIETDQGFLSIHLGMTGKLLMNGKPGPYTRAEFQLDKGSLLYDDIRQFGRIEWSRTLPERIARLGPDPLSLTEDEFVQRLKSRRGSIKPLLLNQKFLRGLGNIYTDEALFRAGIHPRTTTDRISTPRARKLYRAIIDVLNLAIDHRGSSISDYVDGEGRKGSFQMLHQVYGREGEPCPKCGTPIRRIVIGQRGTHYCPRCQR